MADQKADYLQRLQDALREDGRSETQIAACTQYAERLLSQELPVLFDGEHVRRVLRMDEPGSGKYHSFSIIHGGKERIITAPNRALKTRQRWILSAILSRMRVSAYAHGFEPGRSIKTNALIHANHGYAVCLDIKDYFPSVKQDAVQAVFRKAGYTTDAASALAEICCYQGALPQGAPTSPKLSNIICRQMDFELADLAADCGAVYSRYADDMTFSAGHPLDGRLDAIAAILAQYGFVPNPKKTRIYSPKYPKVIAGLIVQNGTVHVPKRFKRKLKQEIYYCQKYGVLPHLKAAQCHQPEHYREYLYGKACYVQMVEPARGAQFLKDLNRIQWTECS